MRVIETRQAVGHVLCHDLTRIVPGEMKGPQFRKGHVVAEEDIPMLLSMGKEHLYVLAPEPGVLNEDEAAARLCELCQGDYMEKSPAREGKIELTATREGLFRVDAQRLNRVNRLDGIAVATRPSGEWVRAGDKLCALRVIPLVIEETRLDEARSQSGQAPLLSLTPLVAQRAALIVTGREVLSGRIPDAFTPVVREKLAPYSIPVIAREVVGDDPERIASAIARARAQGAQLIFCTGGMSVDPDDLTPAGIRLSGARIAFYGLPVFPGAMFLLGYYADGAAVVGLPGCAMYAKTTALDVVLPHLAARAPLTREDIAALGNGGLCLHCAVCAYPRCGFGRWS